jgi:hypothetical protein
MGSSLLEKGSEEETVMPSALVLYSAGAFWVSGIGILRVVVGFPVGMPKH